MVTLKSKRELEIMRDASRIVGEILQELRPLVQPGITTRELDRIAEEKTLKRGAAPAFKGYRGFPRTLCTSINHEVVHGIPGHRELKEGDIVGLDFGVIYNGYYGDSAITVPVGKSIAPELQKLLDVTETSLKKAIAEVRLGKTVGDVGAAV